MRRNEKEKKWEEIFQFIDFLLEFHWFNKVTNPYWLATVLDHKIFDYLSSGRPFDSSFPWWPIKHPHRPWPLTVQHFHLKLDKLKSILLWNFVQKWKLQVTLQYKFSTRLHLCKKQIYKNGRTTILPMFTFLRVKWNNLAFKSHHPVLQYRTV
jgi:hypothetical protein